MNISSSIKPRLATTQTMANTPAQEPKAPADNDKNFADSVTLASRYTAAGAGVMTGFVLGTKAAIESAYLLGISDATALFLAGVAIGGAAGGYAGYHGAGLGGKVGGAIASSLGASEDLGKIVGATAVSAIAGTALTGSVTGTALGAGVALAGGGLVYATS